MKYYIDGYNLLFRLNLFEQKQNLQEQRELFIRDINHKAKSIHLKLCLVFDGKQEEELYSLGHFDTLEIIYTSSKLSADQHLLQIVSDAKKPNSLAIVTSDKKLAELCSSMGANTLAVESFLKWLNYKYKRSISGHYCGENFDKEEYTKSLLTPFYIEHYEFLFEDKILSSDVLPEERERIQTKREKQLRALPPAKKLSPEEVRWLAIFEKKLEQDIDK